MIKVFENKYMDKQWRIKKAQWFNYFESGNYDLSIIDEQIYQLVNEYKNKIITSDRRSKVANDLIQKDLVDKNPIVSELRNRIDALENYGGNIEAITEDVLELMNRRNRFSKEVGFDSYPDLILATEEINKERLIHSLKVFVVTHISKVKRLINKYDIKWDTWFEDLNRISVLEKPYQAMDLLEEILESLGYNELKEVVQVQFMENGFGCCSEINPKDIRIVVRPITSLNHLRTLFHELGHAISFSLNDNEGLLKVLTASQDEGMAVVIEYLAIMILYINESDQEKIIELMTLEYTRCAISALYEFDLWEHPENAKELYIKHYSKLGFEVKNPSRWSLDSFRSIDPVYIHNYVVGFMLAEKLYVKLQELSGDYKEWGVWLSNHIYKDGRKTPFKEKLKILDDLL